MTHPERSTAGTPAPVRRPARGADPPARPGRPSAAPDRAARRQWAGLAVLALPCLVVSMDANLLHLALPRIATDLEADGEQLLWIVDLYVFLGAGSLLAMGMLGDRVGRRRLLLIGAGAFAAASVLAASSSSPAALIACRGLLGVAGATLMPSTLALIRTMFRDPAQRRHAFGIWTASFAIGGLVGPLAGGVVLTTTQWPAVFLLAVPPMLLLLVLGPVLLPESRDASGAPFDAVSAVTSVGAVLATVHAIKAVAAGETGPVPGIAVAAGLGLGAVFVRRQRGNRASVLDRRLVGSPSVTVPLAANALAFFALYGTQYLTSQYLQLVLGLSPSTAGAWGIPGTLAYVVGSAVGPRVTVRVPPVTVVTAGLVVCAVGFSLLTQVSGRHGLAVVVAGSIVFGFGLAPVYSLTTEMVVSVAPEDRAGTVSALQESSAELGGALGIALLGSLSLALYRSGMVSIAGDLPPGAAHASQRTLTGALAAADGLPAPAATALSQAARDAYTESFVLAEGIGAALICATAVGFWLLLGRRRVAAHR